MFAPRQPKPATKTAKVATETHPQQRSVDNAAVPLFPRATASRDSRDLVDEPGRELDKPTQEYFSSRFGHDFSSVRVHTDERAAASTASLSARAYTLGPHVVFGRGEFSPATEKG